MRDDDSHNRFPAIFRRTRADYDDVLPQHLSSKTSFLRMHDPAESSRRFTFLGNFGQRCASRGPVHRGKPLLALLGISRCRIAQARYLRPMGSTISSIPHMLSAAGDLRRQARQTAEPELAAKLKIAAANIETAALDKAGLSNPKLGALLDTFA